MHGDAPGSLHGARIPRRPERVQLVQGHAPAPARVVDEHVQPAEGERELAVNGHAGSNGVANRNGTVKPLVIEADA